MPLAGFEPAIQAGERQQTDALDRVGIGIGSTNIKICNNWYQDFKTQRFRRKVVSRNTNTVYNF
jgi:hypothetical protein